MTLQEESREGTSVSKTMLMPKEEMLESRTHGQRIKIGVPSDFSEVEFSVPLTPQAVDLLTSYGHEIYMETNAGKMASYSDEAYRQAGAVIVDKKEEIFQCDIILRVAPFDNAEIEMLRGSQVVFSNMQIQAHCKESIQALMDKKVTTIAYEQIENEEGFLLFVHQMSQIAGVASITLASE